MKVISIVGEKKSGKTSLIEYLITHLKEYGKVGCIKHAHDLDFSASMKDTDRFFNAGAEVAMGTSEQKTIKICRGKTLMELIEEMTNSDVDFVLVEGFKSSDLPKIALSDFNDEHTPVSKIIKRLDYSKGVEGRVKEIVELILSLEDY
ncbi:molybdopterin-guanine dinucleotide biosynthesis protein B [Methanophagales archaeon]|nr:MAG: molybdopterin-guanine dinucleotide biosynthesis protein B [Methanophagales archaeon]